MTRPITRAQQTAARTRRRGPELALVTGVRPEPHAPAEVARRFRRLLADGARLATVGAARARPERLLAPRLLPRHELRLFGARFFLSDYRFDDAIGFFVGYVVLDARPDAVHPRACYKDSSLLWRVASHLLRDDGSTWIGKGDTRTEERGGYVYRHSVEETANLPYELQPALDELSRRGPRRRDDLALALVVRTAPRGRIEPYADFRAPRLRAASRWRENGGRPVAYLRRRGDPGSLRFAPGYAPDFARGTVERCVASSAYFGGRIEKHRILSVNRRIQYLFLASPTHVWIGPPQLLSTELSSYGVRVDDVLADEDVFLPGYEYHEDGDSQIPAGFAGAPHPDHADRADASAWLEALPVIRAFRAEVLGRAARSRRTRASRGGLRRCSP
jgi:hypothetical protein